ncbi:hypothetical protein INT43_008584, partial [Umbelopsis isabellina]
ISSRKCKRECASASRSESSAFRQTRNLPFKITADEMYDVFGKYGAIRQIRVGTANDTRGTAFVVYEDIFDAKTACDHLQGFNILGRYLIVLYYQPNKVTKKANLQKKEAELQELK